MTLLNAFLATAVVALLSLLGAAAFHPDEGFLVASEPLWQAFGIAAYASWTVLPLIGLAFLVQGVVRWVRRGARHRSQA